MAGECGGAVVRFGDVCGRDDVAGGGGGVAVGWGLFESHFEREGVVLKSLVLLTGALSGGVRCGMR